MASPPRDPVSVQEKGGYRNAPDGPREDTAAYSRDNTSHQPDRPGHIDDASLRGGGSQGVLPNLRRSVRSADEIDRRRRREMPSWVPYALATVALVAIMSVGVFAVLQATARPEGLVVEPREPRLEEMNGVPVREDLNAPGL